MDFDDDDIQLPADTQAILNQFLKEQQEKSEEEVTECWQLSQFWYEN